MARPIVWGVFEVFRDPGNVRGVIVGVEILAVGDKYAIP